MAVNKRRKKKSKQASGSAEISRAIRVTCNDYIEITKQCEVLIEQIKKIPTDWFDNYVRSTISDTEEQKLMFSLTSDFTTMVEVHKDMLESVLGRVLVLDARRQNYSVDKKTNPKLVRVREEEYYPDFQLVHEQCMDKSTTIVDVIEILFDIIKAYEKEMNNE